jgi:hypothetical protein
VRGRIVRADGLIPASADHAIVDDDDRAHGHFSRARSFSGERQRLSHEPVMGHVP